MEAIKALFEALKTTTYGVVAVLLPGAAVLEILRRITPVESFVTGSTVAYAGVAYVCGAAVQGVASLLFRAPKFKTRASRGQLPKAEEHAQRILEAKLGEKIERERVLDLCLSVIASKRDTYDKFVALRDMSRGLALASLAAAVVIVIRHGHELASIRHGLALVACLAAAAGFINRYRRFAPLGRQVVYAQFIAEEIKAQSPRPITSTL